MTRRLSDLLFIPRSRDPLLEECYDLLCREATSSGDALIKIVAMEDLFVPEKVFLAHLIGKTSPRVIPLAMLSPAAKRAIQGLN